MVERVNVLNNSRDQSASRVVSAPGEATLFCQTPIPHLRFRSGQIDQANAALESLLGFAPGTMVEQFWNAKLSADLDFLEMLRRQVMSIQVNGRSELECQLIRRHQAPIWVRMLGWPDAAPAQSESDPGWVFAFIDIDQSRRASEQHRRAGERWANVFESANIALLQVANRIIVRANHAAARVFGYAPGDLIGQPVDMLFQDATVWPFLTRDLRIGATERSHAGRIAFDISMRRANAGPFWGSGELAVVPEAGATATILVSVVDVDATQRISKELDWLRQQTQSLLEHLRPSVFWRDAKSGRFLGLNAAAESLFGLSREKILGRSWHEIYAQPLADRLTAYDRSALQGTGAIVVDSDTLMRADGQPVFVRQRIFCVTEAVASGRRQLVSVVEELEREQEQPQALRLDALTRAMAAPPDALEPAQEAASPSRADNLPVLDVVQSVFESLAAQTGANLVFESDGPELWNWGLLATESTALAEILRTVGEHAMSHQRANQAPIWVHAFSTADGLAIEVRSPAPSNEVDAGALARLLGDPELALVSSVMSGRGMQLTATHDRGDLRVVLSLSTHVLRQLESDRD